MNFLYFLKLGLFLCLFSRLLDASSLQIKRLRPNELRYFSNIYDTYSESSLRTAAFGSNQYSLSCWVKFQSLPANTNNAIILHLTLLNNAKEPSDYVNIPTSYQHLSKMLFIDLYNSGGSYILRGYISYFGSPDNQVFTYTGITTGNWYFLYAGADQINKAYTIGFFSASTKNFQSGTTATTITGDANEELDDRLVIYLGGSKGVPYGNTVLFNGYLTEPVFYIDYYTSSNPEYLIYGDAGNNCFFNLNTATASYVEDFFGSYTKISFGSSQTTLQTNDPIFTETQGLQFSTVSETFMTVSRQTSYTDFAYFSFWLSLTASTSADLSILTIMNTNNQVVFEFYYDAANAKLRAKCLTTSTTQGIAVTLNTWNHIVLIFSKLSVFSQIYFSFFLNGVDQVSYFSTNFIPVARPDTTLPNTFYFGKISTDSSFSGYLIDLYSGDGARVTLSPSNLQYCQISIGITNPFCLLCTQLAYLYNGTCVFTCPAGTYRDTSTKTCRLCDTKCKECSGPTDIDCISCQAPFIYLFGTRCLSSCPVGSVVSDNYTCACDPSCETCSYNTLSGQISCQSCVNSAFFILNSLECVDSFSCPYGYFGNSATSPGACSLTCPSGSYKNYATRKCTSYCAIGSIMFDFGGEKACYEQCPDGYFNQTITSFVSIASDQTQFKCAQCASPCLNCNETQCLSCVDGYFLHENNGSCNTSCMEGYIFNGVICRICQENCTVCPYNTFLYNSTCVLSCPNGTYESNGISCENNQYPLVSILNKTSSSDPLVINRIKDLILISDYIYISGSIDSITWSLSGISSVYTTDFFHNTYKQLKTLTIPRTNLKGNIIYNVTVSVTARGYTGQNYILIKTNPDLDIGIFNIQPLTGVSGVDSFTMTLLLWNTTQNLSFTLLSYNKITVALSSNNSIYGQYSPDIVFSDLNSNGDYSFVPPALLEKTELTYELIVTNQDSQYTKNFSVTLLPYNGNLTEIKNGIWQNNYTNIITLNEIYSTIYSFFLVYGQSFTYIYRRDLAIAVYKAARLLNQNPNYYCDDLVNCHGQGVCRTNSLNSKSFDCSCFSGFAGDTCNWDSREYQLLTNYTLSLMLNLQQTDISNEKVLTYLKCIKLLLELQDLFTKNGIILSIISLQSLLASQGNALSKEDLTLIFEILGLINYQLYERTNFRLDEQKKYTQIIKTLLDTSLNYTENLLVLGDDAFISSKYLDIFLCKKPKFSLIASSYVFNGSIIIPLSKATVEIPVEAFPLEDIVTLRVIQWKSNFEDIETQDLTISYKAQIEAKIGGSPTTIEGVTKGILIYLAKIASYSPINSNNAYSCGYFNDTSMSFMDSGCQFVNESNSFILCNCTHLTSFSANIIQENVSFPPSLTTLINDNNIDSLDFSLSSLLSIDFSQNLELSRYYAKINKNINDEINWNNPGLWAVLSLIGLYIFSCLLNIRNWKKNRFDQIIVENRPILILTYHPLISLSIKAHSPLSHTQQMRLTKLFLTYFSDVFASALLFTELVNVNSEINITNRVVGSILIGLMLAYIFHYFIEWLYRAVFLAFIFPKTKRTSLVYHLICWAFSLLFSLLTILEIGKVKEDDLIYWLYIILILFATEIVIIYTFFLIYPFWTSNRGYFIPSLKYLGFYIAFQNDTFQIPLEEGIEDGIRGGDQTNQPFHPETLFPANQNV